MPIGASFFDKILDDIESGKETLYEARDVKDLLDQLYGRKSPIQSKVSKKLQEKNRSK